LDDRLFAPSATDRARISVDGGAYVIALMRDSPALSTDGDMVVSAAVLDLRNVC